MAAAQGEDSACELLTNGGFEEPPIGNRYKIVSAATVPGWGTTAADGNLEIWADAFLSVDAHSGAQFSELNATRAAMIYQDVETTPGDTLTWSIAHRGRSNDDTIEIKIGAPGEALKIEASRTSPIGAWSEYSATYVVPDGQTTTRFGVNAVDSGSAGNLVDSISLSSPCAPPPTTTTAAAAPTTTTTTIPAVPTVVNGGFESPVYVSEGRRLGFSAGEIANDGWMTTSGTVDIHNNRHRDTGIGNPDGGDQHLDLSGRSLGSIEQTVDNFTVGSTYEVRFQYAIHTGVREAEARVQIGDVDETWTATNRGDGDWITTTHQFVASATSHVLAFAGVSSDQPWGGMLLDNITIVEVADPPPTTTTTTTTSPTTTTGGTGATTTTVGGGGVLGGPDMSVILMTNVTAPVPAGISVWVSLNWTAEGGDAGSVRVTSIASGGVSVSYPENTADHASLHADDRLSDSELDFTALYIDVPFDVVGPVELDITLTYETADGPVTQNEVVTVPILIETGDGLEQTTVDLGTVPAGQAKWVDVWYTGLAEAVGEVELVVVDDAGFGVVYPSEGAFTSLYYSNSIRKGETDVARFRIDTAGVSPGSYDLTLRTSYLVGGEAKSFDRMVTVTVSDTGSATTGMLVVSEQPERTDAIPLDGVMLSGQVYVFFDDTGLDVKKVTFFLDDVKGKTDRHSHFDFRGTARGDQGKPWDTDSEPTGSHTISAVVTFKDGTTQEVVASFTTGG